MEITYLKEALVDILKSNLVKHTKDNDEATEAYWESLKKDLEKVLEKVNKGKSVCASDVDWEEPLGYVEQYREAIEMLELTDQDTILLSQEQFRQYVLDKWNWSVQFHASNSYFRTKISSSP